MTRLTLLFILYIFFGISQFPIPSAMADGLPEKAEIKDLRTDSLRLQFNEEMLKYDFDTDKRFHPFFIQSINTVIKLDKVEFRLKKLEKNGQDTTADYYLDQLEKNKIRLYKMDNLQGRVLRILIDNDIPVVTIKKVHYDKRKVFRVFGDLIYLYREPDFSQSTKKLEGEKKYTFKTALGKEVICRELYEPTGAAGGGYYCVVSTPNRRLKAIKQIINNALSDVGFEYKLPEFKALKGEHVVW